MLQSISIPSAARKMISRPTLSILSILSIFIFISLFIVAIESKVFDPYQVLGVEKNASQREIQKAFHKLSLQYHPDKNKKKGAQEKFAEINNAYEILSDEEKRKNFDLYGDEKGNPGFDSASAGDHGGYTYFKSGGHGNSRFTFRPDEWPNMGGHQQQSESFSFSFGGPSAESSFGFGLNDIFSNFFGGAQHGGNNQFGGFGSSSKSQSRSRGSSKSIQAIDSQFFEKEVANQGITWLLLTCSPAMKESQQYESIIEDVSRSWEGALKAGMVNCEREQSFCKALGIYPRKSPRVFLYSYRENEGGSLVEYNGDLTVKSLKTFCQDYLPKFSKRVDLKHFEFPSASLGGLPRVMLLSTKKDTPVIWQALSGLYRKRFIFYDAWVHDVSDPIMKKLGADALPAIVGWLPDGEKHILKAGISVKDLKSAVHELSVLLDGFERKSKKAASRQAKRTRTESVEKEIPLLTGSNFDALCGETTPVCIIGAFRSSRAREKLESILLKVSHKSLSRQSNGASSSGNSISYTLLDATKQTGFVYAFDKSGYRSLDNLLVAYKPRKGKFAAFTSEMTMEGVEIFISSVLNGDVQFSRTRHKPMLK